jgi:TusA-related sulfurtransferase
LVDEKGEIHHSASLYFNDEDIRFLKGANTPIRNGDIFTILPSAVEEPCQATEEPLETVSVDREIDLRGEVCPYTFIKSLLALEEMEVDQVLRVIVDYLPSVENVPRSLKNEGHEIVEVAQISDRDWSISVRKLVWNEE